MSVRSLAGTLTKQCGRAYNAEAACRRMSEQRFWGIYFSLVSDVLKRFPAASKATSPAGAQRAAAVSSPQTAAQPSHATSLSGWSAWEDMDGK